MKLFCCESAAFGIFSGSAGRSGGEGCLLRPRKALIVCRVFILSNITVAIRGIRFMNEVEREGAREQANRRETEKERNASPPKIAGREAA